MIPASQVAQTEARSLTLSGLRLHYRMMGDPSAPSVIVLHGMLGHSHEWDAMVSELAASFLVFAVDQRGHGLSDWAEEYTPKALAHDLISFIEHLGVGRVRVFGHSMGALAGMIASELRPDLIAQLVVADIGPDSAVGERARRLQAFVRSLGGASYESVDEALALYPRNPLARARLLRHYVEHCLTQRDDGRLVWRFDAAGMVDFVDRVSEHELWNAVDAVTCPVLLVRGAHSAALSMSAARELQARFERAELVVVGNADHNLAVQQPEQVADITTAFFLRA